MIIHDTTTTEKATTSTSCSSSPPAADRSPGSSTLPPTGRISPPSLPRRSVEAAEEDHVHHVRAQLDKLASTHSARGHRASSPTTSSKDCGRCRNEWWHSARCSGGEAPRRQILPRHIGRETTSNPLRPSLRLDERRGASGLSARIQKGGCRRDWTSTRSSGSREVACRRTSFRN
jgi:hypothetical protein